MSLATSTISVPQVLTQVNSGTVFDHALGLKRDGTQELRITGCVIIVNRRRIFFLGKGEPIRSQEGALGSVLTELLDRGSRSQSRGDT